MRKVLLPATAVALGAMLFGGVAAQAEDRATAVDAPNGDRYYIRAHGGEFPTGHRLEVWQETNGQAGECAGESAAEESDVPAGLPVGHATTPEDEASGLQTTDGKCGSDTQVTPAL